MSPVEVNVKAIVTAAVAGFLAIYIIYTYFPKTASRSKLKQHMTWKTRTFADIPLSIKDAAKTVQITEKREGIDVDGQVYNVYFREAFPKTYATSNRIPFLLLHGANVNSNEWIKSKTLALVTAMGYRVVALDLPGWGESKASKLEKSKQALFLENFIKKEKLDRPVIVSPSMSGSYALPYIMGSNPETCYDRVRGYIPVAPTSTSMFSNAQYHRCEVPTMIIYGTKDTTLGLQSTNDLRNLANNEILPLKDAGHAAYLDKTDEWHRNIYNFLQAVEREEGIL